MLHLKRILHSALRLVNPYLTRFARAGSLEIVPGLGQSLRAVPVSNYCGLDLDLGFDCAALHVVKELLLRFPFCLSILGL